MQLIQRLLSLLIILTGQGESVILSQSKIEHCVRSQNSGEEASSNCKEKIFVQFALENDQVNILG